MAFEEQYNSIDTLYSRPSNHSDYTTNNVMADHYKNHK